MMKIETLHPLLTAISENKEGISSYFLAQQMSLPEQKVRYYLKRAEEDGFIKKTNLWLCPNKTCKLYHKLVKEEGKCGCGKDKTRTTRFILTSEVMVNNGFAIIFDERHKQFSFLGCPYHNICSCKPSITSDCRFLQEHKNLAIVKRFLDRKKA